MSIIVLAGGGTGGHVYPALAIGEVLKNRGHTVLYYGDPDRLEGRVAPARGFAFRPVRAMQYPRGGVIGKVQFAIGLIRSTLASRAQLREDKVDAVLGVGGYISAPPVLAAASLGLGRAIHEANVVPGLANKLCARFSQHILLTWEATRHRLPGRAPRHLVGVPVNPGIMTGSREEALRRYGLSADKSIVVFVGGSLGAARINELAQAAVRDPQRSYQVLHLTGPKYEKEVLAAYDTLPEGVCVRGYEDQMALAYAAADLVVCRAGSATLAELAAVGKASLLVPSPNVTENHQEGNARSLADAGAADVLVERGWVLSEAVQKVASLANHPERLAEMAKAASAAARLDAADAAADIVEKLLRS